MLFGEDLQGLGATTGTEHTVALDREQIETR
jgi:hypothetical protein